VTPIRDRTVARRCALAGLIAIAVGVQVHFITAYPQPPLFGDPAAYLRVGRNISQALERIGQGQAVVETFIGIRGSLYFAGAGAFYGLVDRLFPGDVGAIRYGLILLNAVGFIGAYCLGRRLGGNSTGAGLLSVGLAMIHPSFSTHIGRAYPDPLTGALFVWSAAIYLRAVEEGRRVLFFASTLLLSAGLLVRPQILGPVFLVLVALLSLAAARAPAHRPSVLALLAGLLPAAFLWIGLHLAIAATADRAGREDDFAGRYGWTVFRSTYPQGFWQYFETDGWEGPYRLRQEPFYKALETAAQDEPSLLTSSVKGYAFAFRYAMRRPLDSMLLMLDNAYRIFDRPTNGYRWDYPIPTRAQLILHRLILLGALAQMAWTAAQRPITLPIFLVPACLATVHAFTFPWPRYSQPSLLILVAAAAAFTMRLGSLLQSVGRPARALGGTLVAAFAAIPIVGWAPEGARFVSTLSLLAGLSIPFILISRAAPFGWPRLAPLLVALIVLAPSAAHQARSIQWHEREVTLGPDVVEARQSISLGAKAAADLRRAKEAFVVFDLLSPTGDTSGLSISINGTPHMGTELVPTMPRLAESTTTGGRNPLTYRQWWALPLPAHVLGSEGATTIDIRLRVTSPASFVLFGDRYRDEQTHFEGPSFGDFPRAVALKLEYDGDYRIPAKHPLESERTESRTLKVGQDAQSADMIFRIRVLTLSSNEGGLTFETEAALGRQTAWGFFAYSGSRDEAEIRTETAGPFRFPLGSVKDFSVEGEGSQLCYRARRERAGSSYGGYVLLTRKAQPGRSEMVTVSFRSGMSIEPLHFHLDNRALPSELAKLFDECRVPATVAHQKGAARILDASRNSYPDDTGKWRVGSVY
jgi:hypothetical protein